MSICSMGHLAHRALDKERRVKEKIEETKEEKKEKSKTEKKKSKMV